MRELFDDLSGAREQRLQRASTPHEFVTMGGICQVCSLDRLAKIHELPNAR